MGRAGRTKDRLIRAARACFDEKGYDAVRVEDITGRAGVAKGSFYYYFADKQAVVLAMMEDEIADFVHHLRQIVATAEDGLEGLTLMLKMLFASDQPGPPSAGYFTSGMPGWYHSQFDDARNRHMIPLCREIARRCEAEDLVQVPNAEMMAELLYLGSAGWMHINFSKMTDPAFAVRALSGLEVFFNRLLDPVKKIKLLP